MRFVGPPTFCVATLGISPHASLADRLSAGQKHLEVFRRHVMALVLGPKGRPVAGWEETLFEHLEQYRLWDRVGEIG